MASIQNLRNRKVADLIHFNLTVTFAHNGVVHAAH